MDASTLNSYVLTFLTFALVIYTALLWFEAKMTRIKNSTPQISLIFYPITGVYIGMKILNSGKSDAVNVSINCLNNTIYSC